MEGRSHRFFSFFLTILALGFFTAYQTGEFKQFLIISAVTMLSGLFYNNASKWMNRSRKVDSNEDPKKYKRMLKKYKIRERIAWFFILFAIITTIYISDFIVDENRIFSISISATSFIICFAGSFIPDMDLDFGIDNHRNALTHSFIIPFWIWTLFMISVPYDYKYMLFIAGFFSLSYASHLFLDCIPSTTEGTRNILRQLFNFKQSPGKIQGIPKESEHYWLFISASILIGTFIISIFRSYGILPFNWNGLDITWEFYQWEYGIRVIFICSSIITILWVIIYFILRVKFRKESG